VTYQITRVYVMLFKFVGIGQEIRRDMTRSHRMMSTSMSLKSMKERKNQYRPCFKGNLNQCLSHRCTNHLTEAEKISLRSLIAAKFGDSRSNDSLGHNDVVMDTRGIFMQEFKVLFVSLLAS
jgi:hypothetical protein